MKDFDDLEKLIGHLKELRKMSIGDADEMARLNLKSDVLIELMPSLQVDETTKQVYSMDIENAKKQLSGLYRVSHNKRSDYFFEAKNILTRVVERLIYRLEKILNEK